MPLGHGLTDSIFLFLEKGNQPLGRGRQVTRSVPGDHDVAFEFRVKRQPHESGLGRRVDDAAERNDVPHARGREHVGVVEEVEGADDVEVVLEVVEPSVELVSQVRLLGRHQRDADEVGSLDVCFAREGTVLSRKDPPDVLLLELDGAVAHRVGDADEDAEVGEARVEFRLHFGFRAARDVELHLGRLLLQSGDGARKAREGGRLARGDADLSGEFVFGADFRLGALEEIHDGARPLVEELALGREAKLAVRANEKFVP